MMEKCGSHGNYFLQKEVMLTLLLGWIHQAIKSLWLVLMKSKYNYISRDFIDMGYTLKKPYKNKGKQEIVVQPGHEEIIVCRVANGPLKPMKFPPPLDIQTERSWF